MKKSEHLYTVTSVSINTLILKTATRAVIREEFRDNKSAYLESLIKADLKNRGVELIKIEADAE